MSHLPEIGAYAVLRGANQFVADAFRVERALGGMNAATASLGADSVRHFNRAGGAAAAAGIAIQAGIAIGTVALIGFGVAAKNVASDFEETMTFISSITQTAGKPIDDLAHSIDELSTQGTFGLRKLGEGAAELARGGLTIQDISEGALVAAQNFAIAARGELELKEASELVATGLQTFNLEAGEANRITDSITGVAQRSTASFRDLAVAFRYAAPGAVALKIPVEDLSAVMGVLADSGIRGSRAGTALRQVFTTLIDPPKRAAAVMQEFGFSAFDATTGGIRPLRDILIDLEKKFGTNIEGLTELEKSQRTAALAAIFTQNAFSAVNGIINRGVKEYDDMTLAIKEVKAAEVAADLLTTTNARVKIFQATVESAANSIGQNFLPAFNRIIASGTAVAEQLRVVGFAMQALGGGDATPLFKEFEFFGEDFSSRILPIIEALANIGSIIDTTVKPALDKLNGAMSGLDFSPLLDAVVNSFTNLVNIVQIGANVFSAIVIPIAEFITQLSGTQDTIDGIAIAAKALEVGLTASFAAIGIAVGLMIAPIITAGAVIQTTAAIYLNALGQIQALIIELQPTFTNLATNVGAVFDSLGTSLNNFLTQTQTIKDAIATAFAAGDIGGAIQATIDGIINQFGFLFDTIGTLAQDGLDVVTQFFSDLGLEIQPIIDEIGNEWQIVGDALAAEFDGLGTAVNGFLTGLGEFKDTILEGASALGERLAPAAEIAINALKPAAIIIGLTVIAIGSLIKGIVDLVAKFGEMASAAQENSDEVGGAFDAIGGFVQNAFNLAGEIIDQFINDSFKNMRFLGEAFGDSFANAGESIQSIWSELWNNVSTILTNAGTVLTNILQTIWNVALEIFHQFAVESTEGMRFFLSSLGNSFASAGVSLNNIWLSVWNGMIGTVREAINTMSSMINNFFSALASSPVAGFIGGLQGAFSSAGEAIGGALDSAGNKVSEFGSTINTTIEGARAQIDGIASSVGTNVSQITSAFQGFSFEMPAVAGGLRRAGAAAEDFEAGTRGATDALGGGGGGRGLGGAARGAGKAVLSLADAFDIAANKLRQRIDFINAFGEIGSKAAAALSDAILLRTPENADKAVDSLFEIIDAMRENGVPNFRELGEELIAAFRVAIVDGEEGAVDAALALLQQLATEVGLAGRLTVESFAESFDRVRLGATIGKEGESVMQALNKAFVDGSKKNRDALSSAALSYIDALRDNFSPADAAAYGEQVMEALNRSIEEGSGEFLFSVFTAIAGDIQEQGRLTAQSFARAFEATSISEGQGAGAKLMEALTKGITEGGIKNLNAIADASFSILENFSKDLSPENAAALTGAFMQQLNATIEDGSAEALATFGQFVTNLNQQARELKMAESIADQFKKADEAISDLLEDSAAQRHIENLREALRLSQEIALDIFQTGQEAEAINRRRDREDEDITRDRQRALEDLERDHQQRLQDIRENARKKQKPLLTLEGGFTKAATADDEIAEENKKHRLKLENLARETQRADEDRIRKRDQEDADREFTKIQETKLRQFREGQAEELDKFNLKLDDDRLKDRKAKIEHQRDEAIKALEDENTKAKVLFGLRFGDFKTEFAQPVKSELDTLFEKVTADLDGFINKLTGLDVTITITKNQAPAQNNEIAVGETIPGGFSSDPESFQHGGVIPGFGRKLIWAHGGETLLPTSMALSSARPIAPSINSSHIVNNNLTVNANYAQTQSPVRIEQDMHALIMLAGGR